MRVAFFSKQSPGFCFCDVVVFLIKFPLASEENRLTSHIPTVVYLSVSCRQMLLQTLERINRAAAAAAAAAAAVFLM